MKNVILYFRLSLILHVKACVKGSTFPKRLDKIPMGNHLKFASLMLDVLFYKIFLITNKIIV